MIEAVIDTNVLVSALLNPDGAPGQILSWVISGEIVPCLDGRILAEYRTVLNRTKFGFRPEDVKAVLSFVERTGVFLVTPKSDVPFLDESDRKFFDVAVARGVLLVTGNLKHFPRNDSIISPSILIERLRGR